MIRLASWNLNEARSRLGKSYDHWSDIRSFAPDIICLQEVPIPTSVRFDQLDDYLRDKSGFEYCRGMILSRSSYSNGDLQGLAVLSRSPLSSDHQFIRFPNPGLRSSDGLMTMHDKGALEVTALAGSIELRILSLHSFPLHRFGVSAGSQEAAAMVGAVDGFIGERAQAWGDSKTFVVAGDFNFPHRGSALTCLASNGLVSLFDGHPTRPSGDSHDDIIVGRNWRIDIEILPSNSDHSVVSVDLTDETRLIGGQGA